MNGFAAPACGEREMTDDLHRRLELLICRVCVENSPKQTVLIIAQSPLFDAVSRLPNAVRGILLDKPLTHCVGQDSTKKPHSSRSCAEAALHNGLAALLVCLFDRRRLSDGDILDEFIDVSRLKALDALVSKEQHNMSVDTSTIHIERARL